MRTRVIASGAVIAIALAAAACGGEERSETLDACFDARAGETTYADLERRLGPPDRRRAVPDADEPGVWEATWRTDDPDEWAAVLFTSGGTVKGTFCKPAFE